MAEKNGGVAARVEVLVRPIVEKMRLRLWDVLYEKEGADWFLKVLVDKATPGAPMDTDTCEALSRVIDPILDEADPIETSYFLEVGSPGLGRKLTRPEHFAAMLGRPVRAHLYKPNAEGDKDLRGTLVSYQGGYITLGGENGSQNTFAQKEAGSVRLCDDEDLFTS